MGDKLDAHSNSFGKIDVDQPGSIHVISTSVDQRTGNSLLKRVAMAGSKRDVDREDIKAAVRKTGITLSGLSALHGYHQSAVRCALMRPWAAVETIIAARIGKAPHEVWPSRYDAEGLPLHRRSSDPHPTPMRGRRHRQKHEAA